MKEVEADCATVWPWIIGAFAHVQGVGVATGGLLTVCRPNACDTHTLGSLNSIVSCRGSHVCVCDAALSSLSEHRVAVTHDCALDCDVHAHKIFQTKHQQPLCLNKYLLLFPSLVNKLQSHFPLAAQSHRVCCAALRREVTFKHTVCFLLRVSPPASKHTTRNSRSFVVCVRLRPDPALLHTVPGGRPGSCC